MGGFGVNGAMGKTAIDRRQASGREQRVIEDHNNDINGVTLSQVYNMIA
jgi:hypothetical protein